MTFQESQVECCYHCLPIVFSFDHSVLIYIEISKDRNTKIYKKNINKRKILKSKRYDLNLTYDHFSAVQELVLLHIEFLVRLLINTKRRGT